MKEGGGGFLGVRVEMRVGGGRHIHGTHRVYLSCRLSAKLM